MTHPIFTVGSFQPDITLCKTREEIIPLNLQRHVDRMGFLRPYWAGISGAPCRLVVFPEFGLHGIPQNADGTWNGVSIDIPGMETDMLAEVAVKYDTYIMAQVGRCR